MPRWDTTDYLAALIKDSRLKLNPAEVEDFDIISSTLRRVSCALRYKVDKVPPRTEWNMLDRGFCA